VQRSVTAPQLVMRHYLRDEFSLVRGLLVDLYTEVYAHRLAEPASTLERFTWRLTANASLPGWEAVVGYDGTEPVGYIIGVPLPADTPYWIGLDPAPAADFVREDGTRSLATMELLVRAPWRGLGLSRRIHDELLVGRTEQRIAGSVEHSNPKLRSVYESWGYVYVGSKHPVHGGPLLDMIVREPPLSP
jgi:GNAT superfamily N-acetyltransferase